MFLNLLLQDDTMLTTLLYQEYNNENNRRLRYEGFEKWDDFYPAVNVNCELDIKNSLNKNLLNFLESWKEYLQEASKNFRKTGSKCGICTAYSTWLGQKKGGIIQSIADSDIHINSITDLLSLKGCRTGKYSAFIVSLKFNWNISKKEWGLLKKEMGGYIDLYKIFSENPESNPKSLEYLTLLRHLLLSRSHIP